MALPLKDLWIKIYNHQIKHDNLKRNSYWLPLQVQILMVIQGKRHDNGQLILTTKPSISLSTVWFTFLCFIHYSSFQLYFLCHWCGHPSHGLLRFCLPLGSITVFPTYYEKKHNQCINLYSNANWKTCFPLTISHFNLLSLLNECIVLVFWSWSWNLFNSHPICYYICSQCHIKWWNSY